MEVRCSFKVYRKRIRPGLCKCLEMAIRLDDHEVDVHERVSRLTARPDHQGPKTDVGHKYAIHHIELKPIHACINTSLNGLPQLKKISG